MEYDIKGDSGVIYYLDASALLKVYFYEKGSEATVKILKSDFLFFSSTIIYPEILFALKRRLQNKEINQNYFLEQVKLFNTHFRKLINRIEFGEHILCLLKSKVIQYSMKALDAIHLASALWIKENITYNINILCSDKELLKFFKEEGFNIINPEEME